MEKKTTKILGIDQSMNSTGVCLHTITTTGDSIGHRYRYWIITSKFTKAMQAFRHPSIDIISYVKETGTDYTDKERAKTMNIYNITHVIGTIIKHHKPDHICMEGISYGSVGSASLMDLAGLNYCIRMEALNRGIGFNIISPMQLKKDATGNGAADKEEMVWAWRQCDPMIKDVTGIKVDDLADAFFLAMH